MSRSRWHSIQDAAERLGISPGALRKRLERHSLRERDGTIGAEVDGVRARKWGSHWRIQLGLWEETSGR